MDDNGGQIAPPQCEGFPDHKHRSAQIPVDPLDSLSDLAAKLQDIRAILAQSTGPSNVH